MNNKSFRGFVSPLWRIALAFVFSAPLVQAGETVIHQFTGIQGSSPVSALISDDAGNLYGTTTGGGVHNCGTAFELSPSAGEKWLETVLYSFGCDLNLSEPRGSLLMDKQGNLYGVEQGYVGSGLIFELSKGSNGRWVENIIHNFGSNEGLPNGELIWDTAGNLYGSTSAYSGEVFELSPQPGASWKETILYTFPSPNGVGFPVGGPTFDNNGNLYGATYYGSHGAFGCVYRLTPQTGGTWALTVLYDFTSFGYTPNSKLTFDSSGNLYGTTGQINYSEVFELSPGSGITWKKQTIHNFYLPSDGQWPQGTLVIDSAGSIYGTTLYGGLGCNLSLCGTVYKLARQSVGWKETILHQFESAGDGSEPQAGVFVDSSGNVFGTTSAGGGRYGYGTVYEITP